MFRVGILGAENSHAMAFTEIFNGLKPEWADAYPDIRVVAVGGMYPEANRQVFERGGLEMIAERPEDMLGRVDAVMVTARDGRYHAPFARPFIEAGIPAFIDKPFTRDAAEAQALIDLARSKGVPLVGGSSVKLCEGVRTLRETVRSAPEKVLSGDVTAPVSMVNEYGNFWFYAAHLAESCLAIFGSDIQWVWASRHDGGATAVVRYPHFEVTNHYNEGAYHYAATVTTVEKMYHQPIDINDIYPLECASFAKMLRTGEMNFTYEELAMPVRLLAALDRSMQTGEKQTL